MYQLILIIILFLIQNSGFGQNSENTVRKKHALGPDIISTDAVEYGSSISTDGSEIYFVRSEGKWGKGDMKNCIYYSKKVGSQWSKPVLASFSGQFNDSDPHLTYDGATLYFISRRPGPAGKEISADIWKVEKTENDNWGTPYRLNEPLNSDATEYSPVTDIYGHLYFASTRSGGLGQGDLYQAKNTNGQLSNPVNLGPQINSDKGEWNIGVNKNGTVIIYEASEREQNRSPYGDLYISFYRDGYWSKGQNITQLNTTGSDLYPQLSPDQQNLYFTSSDFLESTDTNIYIARFREIELKLKASAIFTEE